MFILRLIYETTSSLTITLTKKQSNERKSRHHP